MNLLFTAELTKLAARPSARLAWIALALAGALGPLILAVAAGSHFQVNGEDITSRLDLSVPNGVSWALWVRGTYVAQVALLLLASQSYAGELTGHTLRDELVRPVSRAAVLGAKLGALAAFSLTSLAASVGVGAVVGLVVLSGTGEASWSAVLGGAAGAWVCEVGFAVFALAVSVVTRSVAGGLAAAFLFVLVERLASVGLIVLDWVAQSMPPQLATVPAAVELIVGVGPFLPSAGWTAWSGITAGGPIAWQGWAALFVWTALAGAVADRVFARTEVP